MPTLAAELPTIRHTAASLVTSPAFKKADFLRRGSIVDADPTLAEVEEFLRLLLEPPAVPPAPRPAPGPAPAAPPPVRPAPWIPTAAERAALQEIFGTLPGPGVWAWGATAASWIRGGVPLRFAHFSRLRIALQLIVRIANPKYIVQRQHPLCGPVVLVESFARRHPLEYVRYVCGLASLGTGAIQMGAGAKQVTLAMGSNLFQANPPHTEIPQADYIALASLRDQGHWLIHTPYRSSYTIQMLEAGTMAGTLCMWMRDAGYGDVRNETLSRSWNLATKMIRVRSLRNSFADSLMRGNILLAKARIAAGQVVFVAGAGNLAHHALSDVTAHGFPRRDSVFYTMFGGHWVTLLEVQVVGAGVRFNIRSWEEENDLLHPVLTMPWSKVGNWYRGFVSGVP